MSRDHDDGSLDDPPVEREADPAIAWTLMALWSLFCVWYAWPLG